MTSTDGELGMKLAAFIKMWTEDGTQLIEHDRRELPDATWLLYTVQFPSMSCDYGRHMAMLLKVDEGGIILKHDLENMTGDQMSTNRYQSMKDWFEQHVGRY